MKPAPKPPQSTHSRARGPRVRWRLALVFALLALVGVGLLARAVDLQVVRREFLQQQGDMRFLRELPIPVSRGSIFDRNGEPLAVSTPVDSLWADPPVLLAHADRIPELARALDVNAAELQRRLEQRSNMEFVYLRRMMDPVAAQAVLALKIPGVNKQREYRRYYPTGDVTAQVLGFTNINDQGQEGLELAYNHWLSGKPGLQRVIRNRLGQIVQSVDLVREPVQGHSLTLSIDRSIQYLAYQYLSEAYLKYHARAASMVIMDARTGGILAMVNLPSFNPNNIAGSTPRDWRNRAVTDVFEPGSVMKAFTLSAALDSGKWTPTSPINTTPGWYMMDGYTIRDVADFGKLNLTSVITKSSNVGASLITATFSEKRLYDMLRGFGFGRSTESGFPGEASGLLPVYTSWRPINRVTISYGYGLNVTALQLAQAYSTLADGGVLHHPTFVKGDDGAPVRVLPEKYAKEMIGMLRTVVSPAGTAPTAMIANYTVAGKTGTAHQAGAGGYLKDEYYAVFCGIVPATDPRLVAVVVVRDPTPDHYGGVVSAPVFRRVMEGALRLLDVPPDNVQHWYGQTPLPTAAANAAGATP